MTPGRRGWIVLALLALGATAALAEPHEHNSAHGRFYPTWRMPDAPQLSCCDNQDCAPAASRYQGGRWEARWSDTDEWVPIPAAKVEQEQDTPDGRSHMCGRWLVGEFVVYCFMRGGGA